MKTLRPQAKPPSASIPPLESSSRSLHPLLRAPHPISKSIKCVCEAEEAHQLTTAPPPFLPLLFSLPQSLAAPPPASPALACRTTSSTRWDPAPAKWAGYDRLAVRCGC
ncbi:unnamed protein product [Pleuronectes platessa]|uniref:Uncharacterized protein n=1 Tax=Pleuronectes platessa TaxID=8262 RepID=A0A9N7VY51_PLEPL|nr:unnamed protein product [Pleuronectes platessa]